MLNLVMIGSEIYFIIRFRIFLVNKVVVLWVRVVVFHLYLLVILPIFAFVLLFSYLLLMLYYRLPHSTHCCLYIRLFPTLYIWLLFTINILVVVVLFTINILVVVVLVGINILVIVLVSVVVWWCCIPYKLVMSGGLAARWMMWSAHFIYLHLHILFHFVFHSPFSLLLFHLLLLFM